MFLMLKSNKSILKWLWASSHVLVPTMNYCCRNNTFREGNICNSCNAVFLGSLTSKTKFYPSESLVRSNYKYVIIAVQEKNYFSTISISALFLSYTTCSKSRIKPKLLTLPQFYSKEIMVLHPLSMLRWVEYAHHPQYPVVTFKV